MEPFLSGWILIKIREHVGFDGVLAATSFYLMRIQPLAALHGFLKTL